MGIRFLFFLGLFCLFIFTNKTNLYATCNAENALETGQFISCSDKDDKGNVIAQEFGTPQKPVDEEKPDGELTPIEPYYWDNPENILFNGESNVKFHFFNFKRDATIDVYGKSKLNLQLYNNTTDINFNIIDGEATYRGESRGKINLFLPNGDNGIDGERGVFYSAGNVNFIDFQGRNCVIGAVTCSGGAFFVGYKDEKGSDQPSSIVINHLSGNGVFELTNGSKAVIKKYDVVHAENPDNNALYAIQIVRGRGEVVFDTEIAVRDLGLLDATFNYYSKLYIVRSETGGKHIFNADSDIDTMELMSNMIVNNNSHILIKTLGNITETNLTSGSKLELLGEGNTGTGTNIIEKIQGEGTLHINPNYAEGSSHNAFKIKDINLNTLILDDGELVIENDTADYTNTEIDPKTEEIIKEEKVLRRIKNITKTGGAQGGELTVQGTVIFDNIDYLKKLRVCNPANASNCEKNTNLTLKKVNQLDILEVNGGKLFVELDHTNYNSAALNVGSANFKGGEFYAAIKDTNTIKHKNTYMVLSVADEANLVIENPFENFKTTLPDWYSYEYRLSDDNKNLMFDAERKASYNSMIAKSVYAGNYNANAMSSYFDDIVNRQTPLGISAKTFTYIDLLSNNNYDTLANNLNSLVPLSKDKYLKTAHFNLKEALDVSKRRGIENKKPYGIWDRRQGVSNPDDKLWFVSLASNGKYDAELSRDAHKSTSYQFGYNLYNWVSNNNREGYTYSVVGGFTKGNLDNSNYSSTMSAFNIGNTLDYRDENDIIKLSFIYGLSSFDTERDYFISNYNGEDFADLDKSRLKSSLKTHEFLMDVQYSHEIFVEYLKSFSTWSNVILVPRVYFTPSIFIGEGYSEKGEYSSLELEYYVSTIMESGFGFDVSKGINFFKGTNIKLFMGVDSFYRYYKFPSNTLSFEEVSSGVKVDNNSNWSGIVISTQAGVGFDYKKSNVSAFYKREIANDYFQNIVGVSYKYSF